MPDAYSRWSGRARDWRRTRQMGRGRYALTYGLTWAAITFALLTAFNGLTGELGAFSWKWLAVNALCWTVGGLLFGLGVWTLNERVYAAGRNAE